MNVRSGYTFAVAEAYENWYDLEDEEVISILNNFYTVEE
jgi:predicted phosphoribosyltransferase